MDADICDKATAGRRLCKVDTFVEATARRAIGERKPNPAHIAAHPCRRKRINACASMLVHVCDARRAAREHFQRAPCHPRGDVCVCHLRLDGEDRLFKPALERKSAAHPAKERHRRMAMAVDKPGKDETRLVRGVWRGAQVDLGDRVALDLNRTEPDRSIRQKHKDVFKFHLCFPLRVLFSRRDAEF